MSRERPTFEHRPPRHGLIGPFGARQLAAGLVVVVVAIILLLGVTAPLGTTGAIGARDPRATPYLIGSPPAVGLRPGDRAPDFTVTRADGSTFTLSDLAGRPLSLAALRGRGVWIDFWATWCPPCQAETPVLRDTYAAYRDRGLALVAISVQETSVADVAAYAARYGLQYTIAADISADIFHRYGVFALPTQFFVDPNGIIRAVIQGPMTMASAAAEVEAILPAAPPSAPPSAPLGVPAGSAMP
ncbi:MAG: redoxin domain-containing protein [Chloroflexi bacterium]|nr:redoxin domain-containing protein [Chloroflexota bacterium]